MTDPGDRIREAFAEIEKIRQPGPRDSNASPYAKLAHDLDVAARRASMHVIEGGKDKIDG